MFKVVLLNKVYFFFETWLSRNYYYYFLLKCSTSVMLVSKYMNPMEN